MEVTKRSSILNTLQWTGLLLFVGTCLLFKNSHDFFTHYMSVFSFYISLALGAAFFVVLTYLTRAGWHTAVKRIPEHIMSTLPIFALLFIPILFGVEHLFEWLNMDHVARDPLIQHKQPYLNLPFFIIRNIFYFISWAVIGTYYWRLSIQQDDAINQCVQEHTNKQLQRRAPIALLVLSITTSFASFDWIMSLFPHWFSTIFGIYYFAGAMVFLLATTILLYELALFFKLTTALPTTEHFHDLSKLLYGFVIFWAYVAFSQYFLTWYANIPEFTQWYYPRLKGDWQSLFYLLILFHFIVPLFGFMSRHIKRNRFFRICFCILLIGMHYLDIRFLIYPNVTAINTMSLTEWGLLIGLGLLLIGVIGRKITNHQIIPLNDPRLPESKKLENAL